MTGRKQDIRERETVLSTRVTESKAERLRTLVESEHRTVSQELRRLIDQRLEEAA